MNVEEALDRLGEVDGDAMLVARPPLTWASEAKFITLVDDPLEVTAAGFDYVLECAEIRHLLATARGTQMSRRQQAELVLHMGSVAFFPGRAGALDD